MRKWRSFCGLSREHRVLLLEAIVLFPVTALSLRLLGFVRTQTLLQALPFTPFHRTGREDNPLIVSQLSSTAATLMPFSTPRCLLRSLVCSRLLQQNSIPHELRIGARWEDKVFRAHAWIEHNQSPFGNETAYSRFL